MDAYAKILSVLTKPMTANEIVDKLQLRRTSGYLAMLKRLTEVGAVSRVPHPEHRRVYVYTRLIETITSSQVKELLEVYKQEPKKLPPGARLISFDSEEMKEKLRAQDKLNRKKQGKIYVASNWNFD